MLIITTASICSENVFQWSRNFLSNRKQFSVSHLQQFTTLLQTASLRGRPRPHRLHEHARPVAPDDGDVTRQTDAFGRRGECWSQAEKRMRREESLVSTGGIEPWFRSAESSVKAACFQWGWRARTVVRMKMRMRMMKVRSRWSRQEERVETAGNSTNSTDMSLNPLQQTQTVYVNLHWPHDSNWFTR